MESAEARDEKTRTFIYCTHACKIIFLPEEITSLNYTSGKNDARVDICFWQNPQWALHFEVICVSSQQMLTQ